MESPLRMPAEWEQHEATWLAWPHHEPDWPGKLEPIFWVYCEIVKHLADSERIEIVCHSETVRSHAEECLERAGVKGEIRYHLQATDRGWLRDSAPTGVISKNAERLWVRWRFNAWAKYENYSFDQQLPALVAKQSEQRLVEAKRPDNDQPLVLEGGAIESDGEGTLLVTEECLLSDIQARNPGLSREGYEQAFKTYLGTEKTIWLGRGCEGDDTHGHIDDLARFVAPSKVVLACEDDPNDANYSASQENLDRLQSATDAKGRSLTVIKLPYPKALYFEGVRLPASYANFYVANRVVLVPTFNDENDRVVLSELASLFPERKVIGIHSVDLVWGFGTLHCLSQQQPK